MVERHSNPCLNEHHRSTIDEAHRNDGLVKSGGTRTAVERASAWLLSHLEAGSCLDAAGWVTARDIEVARSKTGVSRAALNKARRWLQKTGDIEKRRRGYQGPWMYRLVASTSRHCPVCGAVNGVQATREPVPTSEPPPARGGDTLRRPAVQARRSIVRYRPHMARPR